MSQEGKWIDGQKSRKSFPEKPFGRKIDAGFLDLPLPATIFSFENVCHIIAAPPLIPQAKVWRINYESIKPYHPTN